MEHTPRDNTYESSKAETPNRNRGTMTKSSPGTYSVAANIKNSPKYFTCGEKHEIWHTYLSDNTVSKIIIGHRDFRHFQDGCR